MKNIDNCIFYIGKAIKTLKDEEMMKKVVYENPKFRSLENEAKQICVKHGRIIKMQEKSN